MKKIIQGWKAYLKNEKRGLAKNRAKVCKVCEHAIVGTYEKIMKDEIKEIKGLKCKVCGCPLSTKLRSEDSKCPKNKW